jgi:hypothetical protein
MRLAPLLVTLWNCATIAAAYGGSHGVLSHRFVPVADGVVLDARAHLEWTSRDHVQPLPWGEADRFCRESSRGGRTGWRLPEIGELQALYDKRFNEPCGAPRSCHPPRRAICLERIDARRGQPLLSRFQYRNEPLSERSTSARASGALRARGLRYAGANV